LTLIELIARITGAKAARRRAFIFLPSSPEHLRAFFDEVLPFR